MGRRLAASLCAVLLCAAAAVSGSKAHAQDFKPYPVTRITEAQWTSYFREVRRKLAGTMQELNAEKLIVFADQTTQTSYAFTQPGHPAHPAWVTRQVVEAQGGVGIRQIGYFAGDPASFTAMYQTYEDLNDRIGEFMRRDQSSPPPAAEPAKAP
jgi:hypothetical protein